MKKTISLLLTFVMLLSTVAGLDVTAYAANYYESENNNSYSTANNIPLNSTIFGKCTNYNDDDWYKFTLPSRGTVNVSFSFTPTNSSSYWRVHIYKYSGNSSYSKLDYKSIYAYDGTYNFSTLGLDSGTYFILVDGLTDVSGIQYAVTVNYTSCSNWETEFNNSYTTANDLSIGNTINGVCTNYDDDDWYRFILNNPSTIDVTFSFATQSNSSYWRVYIYKYTGSGDYSTVESKNVYLTDGSYTFSGLGLSSGTYFVLVDGLTDVSDIEYGVTVNYSQPAPIPAPVQPSNTTPSKPKKPTIKTPSTNKKHKITAKWNKVSGCNGYQVQFSTKKNFKSGVTSKTVSGQKKTSYTGKFKKGKKYYIRVRAYKTVNGKKYYSSWSKVKSIKCK